MILTGLVRLGRDAEVKYTRDGTAVANLSLAYNYGKKGQDGKRPTQWIDGSLWGDRATKLAAHLTKGTALVVVLEDVYADSFARKDGTSSASLKGRVSSLEFAGGGEKSERQAAPATAGAAPTDKPGPFDDFADSIPF